MSDLFQCGRFELSFDRPKIMGIVNVTPDSFSDGGDQYKEQDKAIEHAKQLIAQGAHILDIGGESTRPNSEPVPAHEELHRVLPVIEALKDCGVPLSIDTFKPQVMQAALDAGVDLINDIYGLAQKGAVDVVAKHPNCGICVMHMVGDPKTMQQDPPDYGGDITGAVKTFLAQVLQKMKVAGIANNRMMIDPGFGFGKTVAQNYQLLNQLEQLHDLHAPILVGVSRKSMLGAVTGQDVNHREVATVTAGLAAVMRGAAVLRVHDVQSTRDSLAVWRAIEYGELT